MARLFNAVQQDTVPADVHSPAIVFVAHFLYQSYFDSTLLEQAILSQPINDPIVADSAEEQQTPGYAVGLHPSSACPVAVQFRQGPSSSASGTYVLKPGQILRPSGGRFDGVRYGIPFGWLGGGTVQLLIFTGPDARCDWSEHSEVIFHRERLKIYQPADLGTTVTQAPYNWPTAFPWTKAVAGGGPTDVLQAGQPIIQVTPTRVLMALRGVTSLASAASMVALFQGTDDFALDEDGVPDYTLPPVSAEVVWPSWTNYGGGNFAINAPQLMQTEIWSRISANVGGGVVLVDASGAATLNNAYVDVVRYGRL